MSFTLQEYNTAHTQTQFCFMLDFLILAGQKLDLKNATDETKESIIVEAYILAAKLAKDFGIKKENIAHNTIYNYFI